MAVNRNSISRRLLCLPKCSVSLHIEAASPRQSAIAPINHLMLTPLATFSVALQMINCLNYYNTVFNMNVMLPLFVA
jgi:hypothetical protein